MRSQAGVGKLSMPHPPDTIEAHAGWNRAKLLWAICGGGRRYARCRRIHRRTTPNAICTARCAHARPTHSLSRHGGRDLRAAGRESADSAEHMMLIASASRSWTRASSTASSSAIVTALRRCFRPRHVSRRASCRRVLDSPLDEITLSSTALRRRLRVLPQGRQVRKVRDNFVRFARMKHERRSKLQVVCRWCAWRASRRGRRFPRVLERTSRVDQVRIKEDETNLMRPDAGHARKIGSTLHYLWRAHVRQTERRRVSCCQSYMLDGGRWEPGDQSLVQIWNSPRWSACDACTSPPRRRSGRLFALLHTIRIRAGDWQPDFARPHRAPVVADGGAADVSFEAAAEVAAAAKTHAVMCEAVPTCQCLPVGSRDTPVQIRFSKANLDSKTPAFSRAP